MSLEYSIVRFSPHPEFIEPVNVAIALRNKRPRLIWDPDFPKLKCMAPGYDREVLAFWLEALDAELDSVSAVDELPRRSPQITVTPPQVWLDHSQTGIQVLQKMLLEKPSLKGRPSERDTSKYVAGRLESFVTRELDVPAKKISKRVRAASFLSTSVAARVPGDVKRFQMAVIGHEHAVVVEAVDLYIKSRTSLLKRINEIRYGFTEVARVRSFESRTIALSTVVFNSELAEEIPKLGMWMDDLNEASDVVVDPASTSDVTRLREHMVRAARDPLV